MGRGDEMGKEKHASCGKLGQRANRINEIRLNSNEIYLKPNYRAHINTNINAS
jgi:hypothetical protein